jgi:DNA invertase Pin-like site-specific DNA recombinase
LEVVEMALAVVYARFSPRPSPEECDSVEKQIERCRAYCSGHGYDVVAVYNDKELSGGRADNRPGLQKAITAACAKKAILCVYSLSRFARNTKDAIDLAERLNSAGADLAVIQENVNTRSPMGRFIFTLFSALAQLEREQIAERTSSAMLRHQANGRRMTHPDRCPFGKRPDPLDPARLIDHPEEQAVIATIQAARSKGKGFKAIAHLLEAKGITCRGGSWHHTTVRSILRRVGELAEGS